MYSSNNGTIKYFLYARKSSESEDRQVQSIDDQVNRLKQLASDGSLTIKEILTEAHSAKSPNARPVFNEMLDRIERGEANGILCWQINRLSRNPVDSARVQWLLQQQVIQSIQTIDGERKPTDNAVLLSVEAGVSNQFILDHIKNVRRGLESRLEKGWIPCLAKTGYLNDPATRTIIPDPDRFHLVKKMWGLMLTGRYRPSQILDIATNEWGFRTRKTKRTGGKPLSLSGMYRILTSQFYCGFIEYGGKKFKGKHIPMITFEEFDRVQELLGKKGKSRPKKHEFAYTGVMHCSECGCSITAEKKRKYIKSTDRYHEYTYYRCTRKKRDANCAQRGAVREEDLESQIDTILSKYAILPVFRDWAIEKLSRKEKADNMGLERLILNRMGAIKDKEKQLDNLIKMRYRDLIDDNQFVHEKEMLQKQLTRLRQGVENMRNGRSGRVDTAKRAFNFLEKVREELKNGSVKRKKELLLTFGSNQAIKDKKLFIEPENWLSKIINGYLPLKDEYERLELGKSPLTKVQEEVLGCLRVQWWTTVNDVRTFFIEDEQSTYIPDLEL